MTRWQVTPFEQPDESAIQAAGGSVLVATLLQQRGIVTPRDIAAFLAPDGCTLSAPCELVGVEQAAALLRETRAAGGKVRVFGDYDTDGQTSTAILYSALMSLGYECDFDIVARGGGRGLSIAAVEKAVDQGVDLLLTCDTGTTDVEAVARGKELGLRIIITDHHDIPLNPPPADVLVSPRLLEANHPMAGLAGAGVALELAAMLFALDGRSKETEELLDAAAIGHVGDLAPMKDDVRCIVRRGIRVLESTKRVGLLALYESTRVSADAITEDTIGRKLAPRLNALGRSGDPELGVELLLTSDAERAREIVGRMDQASQERRANIEAAEGRAIALADSDPASLAEPVLIVQSTEWPVGVLGAVSRRLVMRYERPVIVVWDDGDRFVASGRSIEGVDLHEAIASQADLLVRHGGHPQAAGFTVLSENWAQVRQGIQQRLGELMMGVTEESILPIDFELAWGDVNLDTARTLEALAPFGIGNEKPIFALRGGLFVRAEDVSWSRETAHRRLYVTDPDGVRFQLTWFNAGVLPDVGDSIDLAISLSRGRYRGEDRLDAFVVDWHPADSLSNPVVALHLGPEIVDLRRLSRQRACEELVGLDISGAIWDESLTGRMEGALSRHEFQPSSPKGSDLVIGFVPPDGTSGQCVLDAVKPRRIVLMPDTEGQVLDADGLVKLVLQMVRAALGRDIDLDIGRMASRVGTSERAIMAALRLLEGRGIVLLSQSEDGRYDVRRGHGEANSALLGRARKNILLQLDEIEAFGKAWAKASPAGVLALMQAANDSDRDQNALS